MKKRYYLCLLGVGLTFGCNTNNQQVAEAAQAPVNLTELEDNLRATTAHWNRGDLEAFVAPYDSGSTFMTRTGPVGKAQMLEHYRKYFVGKGDSTQTLDFENLNVRPLGSDYALMTGRFLLTGGGQPDHSGWFSLIWLRTPDGWKILHDHSS